MKEVFKKVDKIYFVFDFDREGELIVWYIVNILKFDYNEKNRIEFYEIIEKVIKDVVKNFRKINIVRVNL